VLCGKATAKIFKARNGGINQEGKIPTAAIPPAEE